MASRGGNCYYISREKSIYIVTEDNHIIQGVKDSIKRTC
jgi:hypothetical protein